MSSARSRRSGGSGRSKSPDHMTGDMPGIRRLVQKRLLEDVFDGASGTYYYYIMLIKRRETNKQQQVALYCVVMKFSLEGTRQYPLTPSCCASCFACSLSIIYIESLHYLLFPV